jgi:SAM-dependent methyltransferase
MDIGQFSLHARLEDRHWWFTARREIILQVLSRHLTPDRQRLVLEIGCGTGGNLLFLRDHYRVMGVDIAPEAVRYARERIDCPILEGDFRALFPNSFPEVDAVLLADVLEHINEDQAFLAGILERLRPGGLVLVTVPAHGFMWSGHDVVLGHVRRYSRKRLRKVWEGLPVEEEFLTSFNTILFPLIVFLRFVARRKTNQSDLTLPSTPLNRLLYRLFSFEKTLLKKMPLPYGVSLLALLKKK